MFFEAGWSVSILYKYTKNHVYNRYNLAWMKANGWLWLWPSPLTGHAIKPEWTSGGLPKLSANQGSDQLIIRPTLFTLGLDFIPQLWMSAQ